MAACHTRGGRRSLGKVVAGDLGAHHVAHVHSHDAARGLVPGLAHIEGAVAVAPKAGAVLALHEVVHEIDVDGVAVEGGAVGHEVELAGVAGVLDLAAQVDVAPRAPQAAQLDGVHGILLYGLGVDPERVAGHVAAGVVAGLHIAHAGAGCARDGVVEQHALPRGQVPGLVEPRGPQHDGGRVATAQVLEGGCAARVAHVGHKVVAPLDDACVVVAAVLARR